MKRRDVHRDVQMMNTNALLKNKTMYLKTYVKFELILAPSMLGCRSKLEVG
jgi:hypothetical protein